MSNESVEEGALLMSDQMAGHVPGKMTASDLVAALRRHYLPESKPPGGVFATEIGSPDGRRRADALWMPLTTSGGTELIGHEVKVSRADVLVELQDPTKAEPWLQYCGRWWLTVSDPALVDGLDIPDAWGIMAPPSGRRTRSMTVIRPAPALRPRDPSPALQRLLAWSHNRDRERINALDIERARAERVAEQHQRTIADLRAAKSITVDPHAKVALQIIRRVVELGNRWINDEEVDLVAQTIVDRRTVGLGTVAMARQLDHLVRNLEEPLGYARREIAQARKLAETPLELVPSPTDAREVRDA